MIEDAGSVDSEFVKLKIVFFESFNNVVGRVFESIDDLDDSTLLFEDFSDASFVGFELLLKEKVYDKRESRLFRGSISVASEKKIWRRTKRNITDGQY